MKHLSENTIEQSLVEQLVNQGYTYFYGPDIAPNGKNSQRESFASVILESHFKDCLKKLNPTIPESARVEAYQKVINWVQKILWKIMNVSTTISPMA